MGALMNEAKRALEDRRRVLLGLVRAGEAEATSQQDTREDRSDQIDADEMSEVVARLSGRERQEFADITAALARIESGQYGQCEVCGQAIGRQRLRALPEARRCIGCSTNATAA